MADAYGQVVTWAQTGELTFDLETVPLSDIEAAWQRTDLRGQRLSCSGDQRRPLPAD